MSTATKYEAAARWRVLRIDDNGNEFQVAWELSREDAEAVLKELESTAHKQHYWIQQEEE